jgi:serine/threonine protein phosphatase 1
MFQSRSAHSHVPRGARGYRAYVVGDVHGRLDLLEQLLAKIEDDLERHPARKSLLVFVGDLIDRGPNSAQVVERLRTYRKAGVKTVFLLGNHEEVLLRILDGDKRVANWRWFGGKACMASYGLDADRFDAMDDEEAAAAVLQAVPAEHAAFLKGFADTCRFGDYLFVHAGVRPGVELERQSQTDLRWIREPFLQDESDHGFVVVHGHTISDAVEQRANRIGIDTGAWRTGLLTALVIEGTSRRILDTASREELADAPQASARTR